MAEHGPYKGFKTGKEAVDAQPKTGVSVIIVGAGIGGLSAAIELAMNGHGPITVFDQVKKFRRLGDGLGMMPNAGRVWAAWPGLYERLDPLCGHSRGITYRRWDGKWLVDQKPPPLESEEQAKAEEAERRQAPMFDCHRGDLHSTLLDYAKEIGIHVRQGVTVQRYEESDTDAAVIVDGERISATVVIGADGAKSKARELVLGYDDAPKSSGYAVFRAFFDGDHIRSNPECAHLVKDRQDARTVWIGPDVHFICSAVRDTEEFAWVMTHKSDESAIAESWQRPGKVEDALKITEGWDPVIRACIASTPPENLLDWVLAYRDPLPTWISKGGRTALLGDAAHPFLPTSIQGASQAVEDGATLAQTLKLCKGDIPMALRTYEEMRYRRVMVTQKLGEEVRNRWHKIEDWDNIDTERIKLPQHADLFMFDCKKYAADNYEDAVRRVKDNMSKGITTAEALAQREGTDLPALVHDAPQPAAAVAATA